MTIAFFDCFSGASGDMLLACLLDAGLALSELEADLGKLKVAGYQLIAERVTRQGLTGTQLTVLIQQDERPARTLSAIEQIIGSSDLSEQVKGRSLAVFRRIATAEAAVHGTTIDHVHFHEIGAVDSLVDVVGFACAVARLKIDAIYSSPLPLGGGTIQTEHGRLPAPAPATLALLAQVGVPTIPGPVQTELVTPTGAALLTEFATFDRPAMSLERIGYGFGAKEFDLSNSPWRSWPNAARVWLGEPSPSARPADHDQVVLLACNLDDASAEALGYAMESLFGAGALDVWFTPVQMKKNRPATQLSVLAEPERADELAAFILRETPTLGVRRQVLSRWKAERRIEEVETPWGQVRVKIKMLGGKVADASPEYEDCARLARLTKVPLAEVMDVARRLASELLQ